MQSFCSEIAAIMEVDEVRPESVLREYMEWDSLTVLSVVAMVHKNYGLRITATDLRTVETAGDLYTLIEQKRSK